ncbi:hypothetical protein L2E82_44807 [Cichorium intybus]|uniref:Uncharacterized protein n=1 Tax=Cichorium intybus TaxID=13427 RepID=A0ACB8ZRS9_CICIN|nr:hypothetical protein L2E82_44807 [Cichorium intybus]
MKDMLQPKMGVYEILESKECVPISKSNEKDSSKTKTIISKAIVQKPTYLKNHQNKASTSKPTVVISKPKSTVIMSVEQYDTKWYMDSGCSRHMTGKRNQPPPVRMRWHMMKVVVEDLENFERSCRFRVYGNGRDE